MNNSGLTIIIDGPRSSGKTWWANQIKQLREVLERLDQRPFGVRYPAIIDKGNLRPEDWAAARVEDIRTIFSDEAVLPPSRGEQVGFVWKGQQYFVVVDKGAASALRERLSTAAQWPSAPTRKRVSFSWMGTPYYAEADGQAVPALKAKLATAQLWPDTQMAQDTAANIHQAGVEAALRARIKSLEASKGVLGECHTNLVEAIRQQRVELAQTQAQLATCREVSDLRLRDLGKRQEEGRVERVKQDNTITRLRSRIDSLLGTLRRIVAATSEPELLRSHIDLLRERIELDNSNEA